MPQSDNGQPDWVASRSRPITVEETAAYERSIKTTDETVSTLNDFLQKLLTLDAALIGGGFIVAKGDVLPYWWGVAVLTILIVSLVAVLYGLMPRQGFVNPNSLGGIAAYRKWEVDIITKKKWSMWIAASVLAVAFAIGVIGMAVKGSPKTSCAISERLISCPA